MSSNINFNGKTRGLCPVCNRHTLLRADGAISYHGNPCPGYEQQPKETYVNPDEELIAQVIREFDYCEYGLHSLHDINEPDEDAYFVHEWPPHLAAKIAAALRRGAP